MADEFLSEHEQSERLKAWIRDNWAWALSGVAIGLGLLGGWQYYQRYQGIRAETAAGTVDEYVKSAGADQAKADALYKTLTTEYGKTPYADQARLQAAQVAVAKSDWANAETALRDLMEHSKDEPLRQVAKLRLARVLIETRKADDALSLLDVTKAGAFAAETHEIRGDALYAKQDLAGARTAYQAALAAAQSNGQGDDAYDVSLLKLKLQDLGADKQG